MEFTPTQALSMHIKDFAAQTGLSTDTLRYYEKEGLLQPARDANGYRNYGTRGNHIGISNESGDTELYGSIGIRAKASK